MKSTQGDKLWRFWSHLFADLAIITGYQYISLKAKSARLFMLELYLYLSMLTVISGGNRLPSIVVNTIF